MSALRGQLLGRKVTRQIADDARRDYAALPITRWPAATIFDRIWALRGGLTIYDAAYVALAEALGCPLVTRDRPLAQSTGHRAKIELY